MPIDPDARSRIAFLPWSSLATQAKRPPEDGILAHCETRKPCCHRAFRVAREGNDVWITAIVVGIEVELTG